MKRFLKGVEFISNLFSNLFSAFLEMLCAFLGL